MVVQEERGYALAQPALGYAGLMRCSMLKGSVSRYQIRSGGKRDSLSVSGGFDRWSVAELFPETVTPRAYCKDSKGLMGGGVGGGVLAAGSVTSAALVMSNLV